ncbi:LAMI_0E04126g1_1 [Lachancea mirantina]|uniref:LAMI_0E04126g1_1 n=1 Tax=Lachancea mirantina TaxID=1230905 RepID=A0A1G4JK54_9SACH|nr:LAMI_0E04126g1_1 [Lachancea mirantina]
MQRNEILSSYKALVKTLVRAQRRYKKAQAEDEIKRQVALLTYKKINLVRQQALEKDAQKRLEFLPMLNEVTKDIDVLKRSDPARLRRLHFYDDVRALRQSLAQPSTPETLAKRIDHIRDIASFVQNQHEYEELIDRYNPGLKMSQAEKVKRTAAKVGLEVPESIPV